MSDAITRLNAAWKAATVGTSAPRRERPEIHYASLREEV